MKVQIKIYRFIVVSENLRKLILSATAFREMTHNKMTNYKKLLLLAIL
jgi:hypothetical protein